MQRLRLLYEQIEEAKRLLVRGTILHVRLALILLDNAAELMMYRELAHQFGFDDFLAPPPIEVRVPGIVNSDYTQNPALAFIGSRKSPQAESNDFVRVVIPLLSAPA